MDLAANTQEIGTDSKTGYDIPESLRILSDEFNRNHESNPTADSEPKLESGNGANLLNVIQGEASSNIRDHWTPNAENYFKRAGGFTSKSWLLIWFLGPGRTRVSHSLGLFQCTYVLGMFHF